jgi:uncharacterized protein (DUF305 family)
MNQLSVRRLGVAGTALLAAVLLTGCGGTDHDGTDHDGSGGGAQPAGSASVPAGATFNTADVRFATDMIPHHQQAIEMARIAETRASNAQVKDLATRIKKAQDPEIATMSGWLRQWGQPVPSTTPGMGHGGHAGMPGMMTEQEMKDLMAASGTGFDRMFLQMMIRHHQGAIEMANTEQQQGQDPQAKQLAAKIASDQAAEIKEMQDLLTKL